jgi:hypothetical protein
MTMPMNGSMTIIQGNIFARLMVPPGSIVTNFMIKPEGTASNFTQP